jgi:DnaA-homolog protein
MQQLPLGVHLRDRATFESFHAGDNAVAVAALREAVDSHRRGMLWLVASRGSGKSHLLQAASAVAAAAGDAAYLPLASLQSSGPEVLEGWNTAGCVCLDDVDAVVGRMPWERALFNLHREVEERGGQLLVSASAPPQRLPFALPDLASRCAAALVLVLHVLDEVGLQAALQHRAALRGLELPDETALYLLRHQPRDMERLCALLEALDLAALRAQRRLTVPFIREVLAQR